MRLRKRFFFTTFLLYCFFFHIHAEHPNKLRIFLYKGNICSIVLSAHTIVSSLSLEQAILLQGVGTNSYYVGKLTMYLYNNKSVTPYDVELISTTYNGANLPEYRYVVKNGAAEIVMQIQKDFTLSGEYIPFTPIIPALNPMLVRTSNTMIKEHHQFKFYLLQHPSNVFVNGAYIGNFRIYFSSP